MLGVANDEIRKKFGVEYMAVVPLISRETLQGVILADNLITKKPITSNDIKILEIFARYASDAIENSRLYGRLEQQISRLKEANEKIIQSRENLIKAEKLSSVAKMALDVAHEIRNPLTVIGGFANNHLRKIGPEDASRKICEIISKQATRIENALDRFSSVVQLSEKKEGRFNLANLLKEIIAMVSPGENQEIPKLIINSDAEPIDIFIDQGLFNQALMVILRNAAEIAGGIGKIRIRLERAEKSGLIFIESADYHTKFAEEFYRVVRIGRGEMKYQEMAVSLEILQYYGGGIGMLSNDQERARVYVDIPLYKEVK